MPGLFDAITDALPTRARVTRDAHGDRYNIHFSKIDAVTKAAINQGRTNQARRISYNAPHFAYEPVLSLTAAECTTLHDELAKSLTGLGSKRLLAAETELATEKEARERAERLNTRLRHEASQHKNDARDTEARLAQITEMYAALLDRLAK
ncbi:hypothetical protein [Streptomyces sp. BH105]|uniref:hypothetical protein n=1 Tax=Streptomyces sp. BH105 TaxID=3410408 RepID=UPI003CF9ED8E